MFGVKREVLDQLYNYGEEIPITGLITGKFLLQIQRMFNPIKGTGSPDGLSYG